MKTDSRNFSSYRVRKMRKRFAKQLRDMIIEVIFKWEKALENVSDKEKVLIEEIQFIKNQIEKEAYDGLVWKVLEPSERHNTPYHKEIIKKLLKMHPNLKVDNRMGQFISWQAFREEDIKKARKDYDPLPFNTNNEEEAKNDG